MAADPAKKRATYADVLAAPPHMTAEVLDGELHLMPRPARKHLRSVSGLGAMLYMSFDAGVNGPGGWTILDEPELHLGPEPDILVPDLGGWRSGRLVEKDDEDPPFITVIPDWVCEILSPGTARVDRLKKMRIYARERIQYVWLSDPRERIVEVYRFGDAAYTLVGAFGGDDALTAEPVEAVTIPTSIMWGQK